jgi:hypothetical protein
MPVSDVRSFDTTLLGDRIKHRNSIDRTLNDWLCLPRLVLWSHTHSQSTFEMVEPAKTIFEMLGLTFTYFLSFARCYAEVNVQPSAH